MSRRHSFPVREIDMSGRWGRDELVTVGTPNSGVPMMTRKKIGSLDAEFNESDHPRGQPENAGQFTSGGGGTQKNPYSGANARFWDFGKQAAEKGHAFSPQGAIASQKKAFEEGYRSVGGKNQQEQKNELIVTKPTSNIVTKPTSYEEEKTINNYMKEINYDMGVELTKSDKERANKYNLSEGEMKAIGLYTGNAYEDINHALREGRLTRNQKAYNDLLNKALDALPDRPGITRRFVTTYPEIVAYYKPGRVIAEKAFMSTSLMDSGVEEQIKSAGGRNVTFIVHGKTAKDITAISFAGGEDEIIFKSGTKFKVLKNNGKYIELEEI